MFWKKKKAGLFRDDDIFQGEDAIFCCVTIFQALIMVYLILSTVEERDRKEEGKQLCL